MTVIRNSLQCGLILTLIALLMDLFEMLLPRHSSEWLRAFGLERRAEYAHHFRIPGRVEGVRAFFWLLREKEGNPSTRSGTRALSADSCLTQLALNRVPRRDAACPGPLEIIPAEPAGDINSFPDHIQSGQVFCAERSLIKAVGIDPANRDFSLGKAFGSVWSETPVTQLRTRKDQRFVRLISEIPAKVEARCQRFGKAVWEIVAQRFADTLPGAAALGGKEHRGPIFAGQKINPDAIPVPPIARNLQDRWTRQSPVSEEACFFKNGLATANPGRRGDARQVPEHELLSAQSERDQRRTGFDNLQPKLPGEVISKTRRPHFGDARAAGGDHQRRRRLLLSACSDMEHSVPVRDIVHRYTGADFGRSSHAAQHVHNLPRRAVAEQLAQRFLMPSDSKPIDRADKILRTVPPKCRFGEMGVLGQKAVSARVHIGEIAPPSPRNQDFLPHRVAVFDQQHPPPARVRPRRAHETRGAPAQYDHVISQTEMCFIGSNPQRPWLL
jgi:hypothetical protein